MTAIPDHAADVQLVVEHAQPFAAAALQRTDSPGAASSTGSALQVEPVNDGAHAVAVGELFEDQAHCGRLELVDCHEPPATRCVHASIPVAAAAGAQAAVDLASQAAVGLLAQVVEVELVDQATRDAHDLAALG